MTVNFMKFGLLMPQLLTATDWRWYNLGLSIAYQIAIDIKEIWFARLNQEKGRNWRSYFLRTLDPVKMSD